jgi:hypothetical protein
MGDKVIVGFISPGQVDSMFAMRTAALFRERRDRIVDIMTDECSGLLSRARNQIVANFLTHPAKAEWLLMLDADQQLMLDGFDKLIDTAHDVERPIVAGLYFGAWGGPFYPTPVPLIFTAIPGTSRFRPVVEYPRDTVIPVDSAGTGCLLVHRSVFEKIADEDTNKQHTWTRYEDGSAAPRWCWFRDMPVNGDWFSEDHFFCAQARQVGYGLHAHTGVVLPHRKQFWLDERHHLLNHPDMVTAEERQSPPWSALLREPADELAAKRAETTEAKRAPERAVVPRPRRAR